MEEGIDIATGKTYIVDTAMSKRRYSDGKFISLPILHHKVWNVENLRGKIHAFVLVLPTTQWPTILSPVDYLININYKQSLGRK